MRPAHDHPRSRKLVSPSPFPQLRVIKTPPRQAFSGLRAGKAEMEVLSAPWEIPKCPTPVQPLALETLGQDYPTRAQEGGSKFLSYN